MQLLRLIGQLCGAFVVFFGVLSAIICNRERSSAIVRDHLRSSAVAGGRL